MQARIFSHRVETVSVQRWLAGHFWTFFYPIRTHFGKREQELEQLTDAFIEGTLAAIFSGGGEVAATPIPTSVGTAVERMKEMSINGGADVYAVHVVRNSQRKTLRR